MPNLTKNVVQVDFYTAANTGEHERYASLARRRFSRGAMPAVRIAVPIETWASRDLLVAALLDLVSHIETGVGLPDALLARLEAPVS